MKDRVCYFSKDDLSVGHYLEMAEKRIQEVSEGSVPTELDGIIELWHIKRMIDDECRFLEWTDEKYNTLKQLTSGYSKIIAKFFSNLNPKMLKSEFEFLEWTYKKTFWKIIDTYKLYQLIEPETLRELLTENINNVRIVLECQGIVEKFKSVIREILMSNVNSAHIILDKYVAKQDLHRDTELYLPSTLTLDDKEQILINYLQSDNPNVNYVRLISQIKDKKDHIRLSPKTRLLAEKTEKKLNEEMLNDPRTVTTRWSIGVQFIDEEGRPPIELCIGEEGNPTYIYSIPYIRNQKNVHRVGNCISLFGWMNQHFLLNLINKQTEVDTIESLLIDIGRDSYPTHVGFNKKNNLALYQMFAYNKVLTQKLNSSFEIELKSFYEEHLQTQYGYCGLPICLPLNNDSTLNKCRVLCPELDAVVKQYNTFVEESEIDKDLIRLSKPLKVEEGKSLLENKYYEIVEGNNEIQSVLSGLLGSGNSILTHVDPFKDKNYHSLIELLDNETNVLYSNYAEFQRHHLDFLIQQGVIGVNSDRCLYIVNLSTIKVLKSLWEYGVCSYWHYNDEERQVLDDMLAKGWLVKDDHLLSKPERDYFSYYLDNRRFTNGMAYRNHYMHGSTPPVDDENMHIVAYQTILRLFAVLILKIDDDLRLANKAIARDTVIKENRG
jgi:hypothetical protein